MTATDELRRLLDERGVEYKDRDMFGKHVFHWGEPLHGAMFTDGGEWSELVVENATPEQAVEATLGRGECHSDNNPPLLYDDPFRVFRCSECHHKVDLRYNPKPNYCPNCGRKVVVA